MARTRPAHPHRPGPPLGRGARGLRQRRTTRPGPDRQGRLPPSEDALLDWFRQGHADLVHTLTRAAPDTDCFAFLPAPSPLAFWARRQTHETTIHRIDAQSALPGRPRPDPVDPPLAADGVDELLLGFFARPGGPLVADPALVLTLHATDIDQSWTVSPTPTGRTTRRGADPDAHTTVSGPVSGPCPCGANAPASSGAANDVVRDS